MADPVTFAFTAASIPAIIAGVQSGLQLVLNAMPEILHEAHDASTKRRLTKLNTLFLKAQMGEFTEKEFEQAKHYYAKLEAVALISQNETMLKSLREGLAHLKTTLVVKNLLDKKPEIESSELKFVGSKRPVFDFLKAESSMIETGEICGITDDEVSLHCPIHLEKPSSLANDRRLARFKALERPAVWCLVAVMPHLLFVPKIRHMC